MRAGRLDRRITVQSRTVTPGRMGAHAETWTEAFTCWANVNETGARERNAAPKVMAVRSAVFTIRHRDDVIESMRILFADREWNITGIKEVGRREGLELTAEATEVSP